MPVDDLRRLTVTIHNTTRTPKEVIAALEAIGCKMVAVREEPVTTADLATYGFPEETG